MPLQYNVHVLEHMYGVLQYNFTGVEMSNSLAYYYGRPVVLEYNTQYMTVGQKSSAEVALSNLP